MELLPLPWGTKGFNQRLTDFSAWRNMMTLSQGSANLMPTVQSRRNWGGSSSVPQEQASPVSGGEEGRRRMIWVAMVTTWLERRHNSSGSRDGAAQGACNPWGRWECRSTSLKWKPPWICLPGPPGVTHATVDVLKGVWKDTKLLLWGLHSVLTMNVCRMKNTLPEVCT